VASQYLRYLTFLAAKPWGKREVQPKRSLDQKRSVLGKGWLPGGVTVLQEMLQKNVARWKPRLKNRAAPHLFIDIARELVLNYAAVNSLIGSKKPFSPGEKSGIADILGLYKAGLRQFPQSLVLRFNLIRTSLHFGQPSEISEALKLAEETVQVPVSNWQIDIMEDVFPYDFESNFFNYRNYFDEVTESLKKGTSVSAVLPRLILASLYYYLGFYTQNIPHLKQAIILDPDFPAFKVEYARQLVRRGAAGDYKEAGTLLTQMTESSILFPEAFELLKQLHTRGLYRSQRFSEFGRFVNRFRHSILDMRS
jgi:tetratricopeptide (TPR) repeat protein